MWRNSSGPPGAPCPGTTTRASAVGLLQGGDAPRPGAEVGLPGEAEGAGPRRADEVAAEEDPRVREPDDHGVGGVAGPHETRLEDPRPQGDVPLAVEALLGDRQPVSPGERHRGVEGVRARPQLVGRAEAAHAVRVGVGRAPRWSPGPRGAVRTQPARARVWASVHGVSRRAASPSDTTTSPLAGTRPYSGSSCQDRWSHTPSARRVTSRSSAIRIGSLDRRGRLRDPPGRQGSGPPSSGRRNWAPTSSYQRVEALPHARRPDRGGRPPGRSALPTSSSRLKRWTRPSS